MSYTPLTIDICIVFLCRTFHCHGDLILILIICSSCQPQKSAEGKRHNKDPKSKKGKNKRRLNEFRETLYLTLASGFKSSLPFFLLTKK